MILGVSHIVLASTDLTRDRQTLESIGWKTQFEQRGIPTHPGIHEHSINRARPHLHASTARHAR